MTGMYIMLMLVSNTGTWYVPGIYVPAYIRSEYLAWCIRSVDVPRSKDTVAVATTSDS